MVEKKDRREALSTIFEESGLGTVLQKQWTKYFDAENFTKLQFEPNLQHLCSIEIHETQKGPYFRIHYKERVAPLLKEKLKNLPGATLRPSSDKVGIDLNGDFLMLAKGVVGVLGYHAPDDRPDF